MNKPLKQEQADMRARWSDPAYRWANDPELRKRFTPKEHEKKVRAQSEENKKQPTT